MALTEIDELNAQLNALRFILDIMISVWFASMPDEDADQAQLEILKASKSWNMWPGLEPSDVPDNALEQAQLASVIIERVLENAIDRARLNRS